MPISTAISPGLRQPRRAQYGGCERPVCRLPGFQRIDVQLATPKKQGAVQLVPGSALIPLN
jgi:hypothetical protein